MRHALLAMTFLLACHGDVHASAQTEMAQTEIERGVDALQQGAPEQALDHLRDANASASRAERIQLTALLVLAHDALGQSRERGQRLRRLARMAPRYVVGRGWRINALRSVEKIRQELARVHFDAGLSAFDRGEFSIAGRSLMRAYGFQPSESVLVNAMIAFDREGLNSEAIAVGERFLRDYPGSTRGSEVEARLGRLRGRSRVDRGAREQENTRRRDREQVRDEQHRAELDAEQDAEREIEAANRRQQTMDEEASRMRRAQRAQSSERDGDDEFRDERDERSDGHQGRLERSSADEGNGLMLPGVIFVLGGAVVVGVSVWLGLVAQGQYEDLRAVCGPSSVRCMVPGAQRSAALSNQQLAEEHEIASTALSFVGGTLMAVGVLFIILHNDGDDEGDIAVVGGPGDFGVGLRGAF